VSQGEAVLFAPALAVAELVVDVLRPVCDRVEIAGSLRRRKAEVHDIEIVAVPRWENEPDLGLLETTWTPVNLLERGLDALLEARVHLEPRLVENHRADGSVDASYKLGPAFKALAAAGIPLDLFITDAERWGCIFALRTGPGAWNIRLVDECKSIGRRVHEGRAEAWRGSSSSWQPLPTPEEADFFTALGQPWVEPPDRQPERIRITRAIAYGAG
jgi:DNA polymerase/3'-5' exonuclease PolX